MSLNLDRLDQLCKGNAEKKQRYLRQFLEMIPPAIEKIRVGLEAGDSQAIRQAVHFLAPQLAFFGIEDFALILKQLGRQPDRLNLHDLHQSIVQAVDKTSQATTKVQNLMNEIVVHENKKPDH